MAAKASNGKIGQGGKKRKGVHSKSRNSVLKKKKNYKKPYKGQGK